MRGQPAHSIACTHSTVMFGISPSFRVRRTDADRIPPAEPPSTRFSLAREASEGSFGPRSTPEGMSIGAYRAGMTPPYTKCDKASLFGHRQGLVVSGAVRYMLPVSGLLGATPRLPGPVPDVPGAVPGVPGGLPPPG